MSFLFINLTVEAQRLIRRLVQSHTTDEAEVGVELGSFGLKVNFYDATSSLPTFSGPCGLGRCPFPVLTGNDHKAVHGEARSQWSGPAFTSLGHRPAGGSLRSSVRQGGHPAALTGKSGGRRVARSLKVSEEGEAVCRCSGLLIHPMNIH